MKTLTAILIDVTAQTVTAIEIKPGLEAMYKAIGCDTVCMVPFNNDNQIWLDDNGRLAEPPLGRFRVGGHTFHGNGLILGVKETDDGQDSTSTFLTAQQVLPHVTFLPAERQEPVAAVVFPLDKDFKPLPIQVRIKSASIKHAWYAPFEPRGKKGYIGHVFSVLPVFDDLYLEPGEGYEVVEGEWKGYRILVADTEQVLASEQATNQ